MKLSKLLSGLAACVLASASLAGCIIVDGDDDHVYYGSGSLTVELTIDGSRDPWQCVDYDVEDIVVSVADEAGFVTEASTDCDALGLTIPDLPEGYYDVEIWLEEDGFQESDVVLVRSIDVLDGTDTLVEVDFPWTSIDP
ncbi:hypothetical protein WME99_41090 [Sorangium sp. So ce136]|uniref:hypothetical protein n=1 Tax=Sorangium sp. So ce136 TaxID=3133284 RepID=UPI003F068BEE